MWSAEHSWAVWSVAYSPNGKLIASASRSSQIALWSAVEGEHIGDLVGHTLLVHSIAFSPDGRQLASASDDKTIRLWDVAKREQIGPPLTERTKPVRSVTFSPDGSRLASVSGEGRGAFLDCTVHLWDISSP